MNIQKRIEDIDAQINALLEEKKKLKYNDSFFDGPNFSKLCEKKASSDKLVEVFSRLIRVSYGLPNLRPDIMNRDRGEAIKRLIEEIAATITNNPLFAEVVGEVLRKEEIIYTDGVYTYLEHTKALSTRAVNMLGRAGIITIRDLITISPNQIRHIRNIGSSTFGEIMLLRRFWEEKFESNIYEEKNGAVTDGNSNL